MTRRSFVLLTTLAGSAMLAAPVARTAGAQSRVSSLVRSRTIASIGFPNGLSLDGPNDRTIDFRLPGGARIDSARLSFRVRFSPGARAESNLQVFVNGVRRGVVLRSAADGTGAATLDVPLGGTGLNTDYASVRLQSSVAVTADRCVDDRVSLSFIEVDPSSSFTYYVAPSAITDVRQVVGAFPDTVVISLPARALAPEEFSAVTSIVAAVTRGGRVAAYVTLPEPGDVMFGSASELAASELAASTSVVRDAPAGSNVGVTQYQIAGEARRGLFIDADTDPAAAASFLAPLWTPLTRAFGARVHVANAASASDSAATTLTLQDLGVGDLSRTLGAEAVWNIPLDLKDLPAGRVPSRVRLRLATAPNTGDRQLVAFVFLNGTLVRSADVAADGVPQTIDVRLPAALLSMHNELRVSLQRNVPKTQDCGPAGAFVPAQLLPTSEVETTPASATHVFSGIAASLASGGTLYLPREALEKPVAYVPMVAALGRAFWNSDRAPRAVFYDAAAPASPTGAFVVVGRPASSQLVGPVTVDTGRLRIRRRDGGETMLDVADLRGWSMIQVVRWNGHDGVQLVPAPSQPLVPDWPDAYGNNTLVLASRDSALFAINTAGREGTLLFNDGPTILERIRADWILWAVFGVLLAAPLLFFAARTIVRRTPRRQLSRVSRTGMRPPADGSR